MLLLILFVLYFVNAAWVFGYLDAALRKSNVFVNTDPFFVALIGAIFAPISLVVIFLLPIMDFIYLNGVNCFNRQFEKEERRQDVLKKCRIELEEAEKELEEEIISKQRKSL